MTYAQTFGKTLLVKRFVTQPETQPGRCARPPSSALVGTTQRGPTKIGIGGPRSAQNLF